MRKRGGLNVKCRVCGKEFYIRPYFSREGWGKYCSKKCKDESQKTGQYVICAYCGEKVYRTLANLRRESKTKTYFCNKSCQCAWKNKRRKGKRIPQLLKKIWGSWCNSSIKVCGTLGTDANSADPPFSFLKFLKLKKKKTKTLPLKRPSKKVLYNLYWEKNYSQTEIAKMFHVTHTSAKRWFNHFKIQVKPRTLSCGRNPNSIKNLELGKTPEAERKSAEARRIYTKEKLIQKIREFAERHGRPPTKNEFINDPFCPDYVTYRDYFGTWNNAIKAAGYEPNEQWFAPKNSLKDLRAKDGHLCKSISEIIIDDWLFENDTPHTREQPYPEGRYRCDFVINNVFIEFFGLADTFNISPYYNEIIKRKKEMCKKHNIQLIELYEKDLYNLDQALGEKLGLKSKQETLL